MIVSWGVMDIPGWLIWRHLAGEVQRRGKRKIEKAKEPMGELDAAPEESLTKAQLIRLVNTYWSIQPGFVFPAYISLADADGRREVYGIQDEADYPVMVTEQCEFARQIAYTNYPDKKMQAALDCDEEVVLQRAVR